MTPAQWFSIANPLALLGWICLIASLCLPVASAWTSRLRLLAGRVVPLLLCVGYAAAVIIWIGTGSGGGFSSLDSVAILFSSPVALLAGWIHYLAFDLFIGRWIVDDAVALKTNRITLIVCLLLTFMFGPLGLLLYFGLRVRRTRPLTSNL
ncbi:MAG: ABA4-like family protein [Burkholderiaceae bacterium]